MHLDIDLEQELRLDSVFSITGLSKEMSHTIYLISDSDGLPLVYYSDLLTPVCIDDICKPLYLELYWNLVGDYAGFGLYPDEKLSKFDHDLFTPDDYVKLDELLRNRFSALDRRELSELYTNEVRKGEKVKYKGQEVDGISGATIKEIKEEVVEGALYSCYTLWHLAYGEVRGKIKMNAYALKSDAFVENLLQSELEEYWITGISLMTSDEKIDRIKTISSLLMKSNPLNRGKVLKALPKEAFVDAVFSEQVYGHLDRFDHNSKTIALQNLAVHDIVSHQRAVGHLSVLSKNQIEILLKNIDIHNEKVKSLVEAFSNDARQQYAYIAKAFLKQLNK